MNSMMAQGNAEPHSATQTLRIRMDLSYDGTYFHGWAAQPELRTVQGEIEKALSTIVRAVVNVTVAGRTDAGVHAAHQVIHADIPYQAWEKLSRKKKIREENESDTENRCHSFKRRMNALLAQAYSEWARQHGLVVPKNLSDVVIFAVAAVHEDFDARFAASGRVYAYRVAPGTEKNPLKRWNVLWHSEELDVTAMHQAAQQLLGEHDFLSYCRPREGATTIRTLRRLDVEQSPDRSVIFHVEADAFCHSMVRSLVGALLEVGAGRRSPTWPRELLDARSRQTAAPIAPAHGLTLERVDYPPQEKWAARVYAARHRRDGVSAGECGCL
ncbi:tRNA pseudouridine(38-40) synthase TruA [Schaalia sp. lx-100]|uniref:tRNA pseudouridine(38-40) synthase TruA n=1 Tax=Schaalia sp. lx-100 TaxID=2899081 RepID=UPI001E625012|nr:tRNA pseudouridine(38-40) synthase TruA [Schaalia sp. lx-100]MCD4556843.1 tRNA pseudouridine(38-40) synthase TruA [Schaalia sp. lx-100]